MKRHSMYIVCTRIIIFSPSFLSVLPMLQRAVVRVVLHSDPVWEQYSFLTQLLVLIFRPFCEPPLVGEDNLCVCVACACEGGGGG